MWRFKLIILLGAIMCVTQMKSNNPFGCYITRYVVYNNNGRTSLAPSERTLCVDRDKITVPYTLQGKKSWEISYMGTVKLNKYNNFFFHKFYLKNKKIYCYISDERIVTGDDNQIYYMIELDGQVQLADKK